MTVPPAVFSDFLSNYGPWLHSQAREIELDYANDETGRSPNLSQCMHALIDTLCETEDPGLDSFRELIWTQQKGMIVYVIDCIRDMHGVDIDASFNR